MTLKAPFVGLAASSVTYVVARTCARAGVPRFGPHRVRQAAGCGLLAAGASVEEIGQLLRHAQQRTTAIYAKVDQARLAELAYPQGAAVSMRALAQDYLAMRRLLGYQLQGEGRMLAEFAARCDDAGQATITTAALAWATEPQGQSPAHWRRRLSVVRGFARPLATLDPTCQIPRRTCSWRLRTGRRRRFNSAADTGCQTIHNPATQT